MKKHFVLTLALMTTATLATNTINLSMIKKFLGPTDKVTDVKESVIPGIYEIALNGRVLYVSADGEKVINGEIYDVKNRVNYTEESNQRLRKKSIDRIAENDKIIYKANDEKYKVTVFTDITCGYCRKLHTQMEDYNKEGITIEYLAFPRDGLNSKSAKAMQRIWCSDNKTVALTKAKNNNEVPKKSCQGRQVEEQFRLGNDLGINGTPAIIFSNGEISPGYLSPEKLLSILKTIKN